eukprot:TRINITY_DN5520_c0_g1_i1.p2 TRINITY_DN5520_c0_g1~~TRINITY_DN5520_c0_g1_i1.p2  ORF type:complete len:289 (-),score=61.51 TRINITY_DN5520_c0_g1_i1:61-927(-)
MAGRAAAMAAGKKAMELTPQELRLGEWLFLKNRVEFKKSISDTKHLWRPDLPEITFAGRSNVGKSSLINSILNKKKLVETSKRPGKTQTLNYFEIIQTNKKLNIKRMPRFDQAEKDTAKIPGVKVLTEEEKNRSNTIRDPNGLLYLVDMPGYGYAAVPDPVSWEWRKNVLQFLKERDSLVKLCLLIDTRRGVGDKDHDFITMLEYLKISWMMVLTKSDKLSEVEVETRKQLAENYVRKYMFAFPKVIATSSLKGTGMDELRAELALGSGAISSLIGSGEGSNNEKMII